MGRRLVAAAALLAALAACGAEPGAQPTRVAGLDAVEAVPPAGSWRPAPRDVGGLRVLATSGPGGFALHTTGGDRAFLGGVNLQSTTPGHQPGELAISAEHYREWFPAMARLGIRTVRTYTIHPPAFYSELVAYNDAHPDAPLYLLHGVYLPDESYVAKRDLYDPAVTAAMSAEVADAVAAAHGALRRAPQRGRASGEWTADVSPWLAGWVVGVEWDGVALLATDTARAGVPPHRGRFFRSADGATPSETWIAARLDELAAAQAARGVSVPVAAVNWPTADPLRHPDEPLLQEDLAGVDANRILPTPQWPGGTFASYHAYPYYPDFLRHEPALQRFEWNGGPDPYAGYLAALRDHHAPLMPMMVTEFGVPSSLGAAHLGTLGRDQGGHSEQEAMRIDAALLRTIRGLGLAGGFVFAWTDEWFKFTWNTIEHQRPADRRQLWHDPLTNEQHFGIVATDAAGRQPDQELTLPDGGPLRDATVSVDESFVHVTLRYRDAPAPVTIAVDGIPAAPGPPAPGSTDAAADHAVVLDPGAATGQAWLRRPLDPVQLDYGGPTDAVRPQPVNGWIPFQLIMNRPLVVPTSRRALPPEFQETGLLRRGPWDPADAGYDSRNTWRVEDDAVHVRIPWGLLGVGDPSSRTVVVPDPGGPREVAAERLGITVDAGGRRAAEGALTWAPWNAVRYDQRLKAGAAELAGAFAETSG